MFTYKLYSNILSILAKMQVTRIHWVSPIINSLMGVHQVSKSMWRWPTPITAYTCLSKPMYNHTHTRSVTRSMLTVLLSQAMNDVKTKNLNDATIPVTVGSCSGGSWLSISVSCIASLRRERHIQHLPCPTSAQSQAGNKNSRFGKVLGQMLKTLCPAYGH